MFQIRLQVFSYLRRKEGHAVDIALLGNGTVAKGLISHLQSQKNKGCELFSIRHILLKPDESLPDPVFTSSIDTILNDKDVSIVVEAMGGRHPAFEYLKAAILSKKHVVTSNKELVSFHGAELARLAQENQVAFFFSRRRHPSTCLSQGYRPTRNHPGNNRHSQRDDQLYPGRHDTQELGL
jgi:predicted homoserine dehydrogenase-like protein